MILSKKEYLKHYLIKEFSVSYFMIYISMIFNAIQDGVSLIHAFQRQNIYNEHNMQISACLYSFQYIIS